MHTKATTEPSHESTALGGEALSEAAMSQTPEQTPTAWAGHPINLRFSVPFFHTRFYLTVVAGRERRPEDRRRQERTAHPVVTVGNALFAIGVSTLITLMGLSVLIASSAIIEY
ncbi:hypothetical protein [Magnetovibrio blakemorei]|uniref:Uncharacterized protein n=1 Tax=Magnetovibrio blakemorei TaxID=28181 RepID=A0A1E5Q3N2_9PROT|nr:hypothetical protein [Magnetovibrio blakemorei]OEJ64101.1 hypothetical protein BEN30_01495 [Magnetovibrio blakemorei]